MQAGQTEQGHNRRGGGHSRTYQTPGEPRHLIRVISYQVLLKLQPNQEFVDLWVAHLPCRDLAVAQVRVVEPLQKSGRHFQLSTCNRNRRNRDWYVEPHIPVAAPNGNSLDYHGLALVVGVDAVDLVRVAAFPVVVQPLPLRGVLPNPPLHSSRRLYPIDDGSWMKSAAVPRRRQVADICSGSWQVYDKP